MNAIVEHSPAEFMTQAVRLEDAMRERERHVGGYLEDMELAHYFSPGIYVRKIYMRAGLVVVSKIHRQEGVAIISRGKVWLATERGPVLLEAGDHFTAPAGTKRVLLIAEDCIWTTTHPNPDDCRDLKKLESRYIIPEVNRLPQEEFAELVGR